jgi:L-fucose isomerase-like protein
MPHQIRIGITAVSSPLEVGAASAPALAARLGQAFADAGFPNLEIFTADSPVVDPASAVSAGRKFYDHRVDVVCVIAASWFEDYLVLDLLEECDVPVVAWARPGMETGSLCGMQQISFILKQMEKPYLYIFQEPESRQGLERAYTFAAAAATRSWLRRARIGYLGHRVEGMTDTTAHELALKKMFGPRVVNIDSQVFADAVAQVAPDSVAASWEDLARQVGSVSASREAGIEALQTYVALKETIQSAGLSAVAIGCYPHLMGKVCLGMSLLAEEGIPNACEGDVNGAMAMMILSRLADGAPVHNTDMLDPIPDDNAFVFSHCGNGGFSLAADPSSIELGPVRLMDQGVVALFTARPGPVTLLNVVAAIDGYRMGVLFGEAIETDMVFPGNPLKVTFAADYQDILTWIAQNGLGHHWMAAYGDLRLALTDLAGLVGCELLHMSGAGA